DLHRALFAAAFELVSVKPQKKRGAVVDNILVGEDLKAAINFRSNPETYKVFEGGSRNLLLKSGLDVPLFPHAIRKLEEFFREVQRIPPDELQEHYFKLGRLEKQLDVECYQEYADVLLKGIEAALLQKVAAI
ncbi:MAG: hypothetical protein Q7K43_02960, partial [Candidatus Woesearchaeota archaeon]|nr:hypothetical protein [Candidatus Woesearchaeota archaeon]